MVTGESVFIEQDLNTRIDWKVLTIPTTANSSSLEKQSQKSSSFLCSELTRLGITNVGVNTITGPTNPTPNIISRVQCPICFRFSPTKDLGRCHGIPTADYPLKSSNNNHFHEGCGSANPRKRKRTEMRAAHEIRFAPCHECLDTLGEEDGQVWGRCDNPKCWSRRGETGNGTGGAFAYGVGIDGFDIGFPGVFQQMNNSTSAQNAGIGLVCPDCSPEGGLGCAHKWICDMCAFWGKFPLVWECPGCQNDFCDQCPEMEDRCVECGCSDLCRDCKQNPSIIQNLKLQMAMRGESQAETSSGPLFSWRCRLCNVAVCSSCVGTARWAGRIDDCANCQAQLCMGCRSLMECMGCGEEMCQLCPMESLALQCERCARTKDPFSL